MTYSYIFALSGPPVPRLIERIHTVTSAGHKVGVAYFRRSGPAVKVGEIVGADIFPISVPFRAAGLDRAFAFPKVAWMLYAKVLSRATYGAFVYVDSLDLLAAAHLVSLSRGFSLRYEVRDLHQHQLSPSLVGRWVRWIERRLTRNVDRLILTSSAYFERYYKNLYDGPVTLLENLPDPDVWENFSRKIPKLDAPVTVGLVGAIRYTDCILALIEGARLARARGTDVRLKIVGPDMVGNLRIDARDDWIERSGPFDYVKEIKSLYSDLDLIWSVYDTRIENVRLALSNKLYESLFSGIPIVGAEDTHLSDRIYEMGIGIAVRDRSAESIAEMLCSVRTGEWHERACQKLSDTKAQIEILIDQHRLAELDALFR